MHEEARYSQLLIEINKRLSMTVDGFDIESIREAFIKQFTDVIRISLKATINPDEFRKFINIKDVNDNFESMKYIALSLENEKSYEIINSFLLGYLELLDANLTPPLP